jgi:hypothetical protein
MVLSLDRVEKLTDRGIIDPSILKKIQSIQKEMEEKEETSDKTRESEEMEWER